MNGTMKRRTYAELEFNTCYMKLGVIQQRDGWTLDSLIDLALDTGDRAWFYKLAEQKKEGSIVFFE